MVPLPERFLGVPRLPTRRADSHKGDYGRVLVVAGSRGYAGAAVLCGRAALRGGAGLVTVACPHEVQNIVAAGDPCYMTTTLTDWCDDLPRADAIAVGPGLGRSPSVINHLSGLLACFTGPLVLDADALAAIVPGQIARTIPAVLTPHPGEFAAMTGMSIEDVQANREAVAAEYAEREGVVLLLKGAGTVVTDGRRMAVNGTGNPGMATGGSGDVLTGLIAALLGQGLPPFEAAVLGAWIHGKAGDLAAEKYGEISLIASDIIDQLPDAFRMIRAPTETSRKPENLSA